MKNKSVRFFLRLLCILAALVVIVIFSCFDRVDYHPYFRESYYKTTIERLHAHDSTNANASGEIFAGFGRAKLTPILNATQDDPVLGKFRMLPLAGYGDRKGHPATGTHDDLYVKCAAIRVGNKVGIMLGADALIIPREVADIAAERLHTQLGLQREQLYLSATHTHCGLGGWAEGLVGEAFSGKFNSGARTWFAECIVAAVRDAVADLKPAFFGHSNFMAPEFIRNRLVGELGKSDPEFSFVLLKQTNGKSALLGSYSAHATVLSGSVMQFSADYPGYWQRAMEESGDLMAIFLAGGVGSQGPVSGSGGFEGAQQMGTALARRLQESLPHIKLTNWLNFSSISIDLTMPPLNVRMTDDIRLRPWLSSKLLPASRPSFIQVFRLGESLWISTPCDFSGELALSIKDTLRSRGYAAVVTSFNGDYIGYVISPRYYHMSGYEPRLMSFYGPYVPDYFDEIIRDMAFCLIRN